MKVLIVTAHNEPQSFNAAMKNLAVETLTTSGHEVKISDLYEMNFNPIGGVNDFKELSNKEYFQYMMEQQNASKNDLYVDEIKSEQEKVKWADLIIFQTPVYWFSVPAILKGWIDRVMSTGFAWDFGAIYDEGLLRGKRAMLSVTTGGPEEYYRVDGPHGITLDQVLYVITHGTFYFCGMEVLPIFVSWSTFSAEDDGRKKYLEDYEKVLKDIENIKPMDKHSF